MTWHDVDLTEKEVSALNESFSISPYKIIESQHSPNVYACVNIGGTDIPFMDYTAKVVIMYHANIERLPKKTQREIKEKLKRVNSLEQVIEKYQFEHPE